MTHSNEMKKLQTKNQGLLQKLREADETIDNLEYNLQYQKQSYNELSNEMKNLNRKNLELNNYNIELEEKINKINDKLKVAETVIFKETVERDRQNEIVDLKTSLSEQKNLNIVVLQDNEKMKKEEEQLKAKINDLEEELRYYISKDSFKTIETPSNSISMSNSLDLEIKMTYLSSEVEQLNKENVRLRELNNVLQNRILVLSGRSNKTSSKIISNDDLCCCIIM